MRVVAVTKCPVGIAHTYIAAERLELVARRLGHEIKVETQGAHGTRNRLAPIDIATADRIIIASDVTISGRERFSGRQVIKTSIKTLLKNTEIFFNEI